MTTDVAPTPERALYTRADFERLHHNARHLQKVHSWILAGASIGLGAILLFVITILRDQLGRTAHLVVTFVLFIAYLVALGAMLLSLRLRLERSRAVCPNCGVTLDLLAEHVALDSGECNECGGRVIQ